MQNRRVVGVNTLHDAVRFMDLTRVKELVEGGADVNAKNGMGLTPLHMFNYNYDSTVQCELLRFFLKRGASVDYSSDNKWTVAASVVRCGTVNLVKILIEHGAVELFTRQYDGMTLLHHATNNLKNPEVIELFQSDNIDVEIRSSFCNRTPMWFALMFTQVKAVQFLLKNGASANIINEKLTDLMWCVLACAANKEKWEDGLKCTELLLSHGADCEYSSKLFEWICHTKAFALAEPILGHLAMREALGIKLKESSISKINSYEKLKNYFDFCKQIIKELKRTVLYNKITLFTFLKEDENRLALYARNEDCVTRLEMVLRSKRNAELYIMKTLRKQIARALETAKLREKSAKKISKITVLGNNWDLINVIIMYLNNQDLENLCRI